jgi:hypothetical protein
MGVKMEINARKIDKKKLLEEIFEYAEYEEESLESISSEIVEDTLRIIREDKICSEVSILDKKISLRTLMIDISCDGEKYRIIWNIKARVYGLFREIVKI